MPQKKRRPASSGAIRKLPSGRYQARFRGPDGVMRPAGLTFDDKATASAWLAAQMRDVELGIWSAPEEKQRVGTFRAYATAWLATRDLKPSTRALYADLLEDVIFPGLGHYPLDRITVTTVGHWYDSLDPSKPTRRAHAYSLARSIFRTAHSRALIPETPCRIEGAGSARKKHQTKVASLGELEVIAEAMPERYRPMVLLAAWCGLRFGELAELRRDDVDLEGGYVSVERGVVRVAGEKLVGSPKSDAGRRRVTIPPHLIPMLTEHLARHVGKAGDALLFPARNGGHMVPSTLYAVFYPAREKAGRPDLRFHDLRHTGATLAAATGATLADLMHRLGHSTSAAAMRYQHAAQDRDKAIAEALSGFAEAKVVPLRRAK